MGILVLVVMIIFLLGRYAIREGQRIEEHNKFIKNIEEYEKKEAGKQKSKV